MAAYDGTSAYRISIKKPASFRHEFRGKESRNRTGCQLYWTETLRKPSPWGTFRRSASKGCPGTGHCGETFNAELKIDMRREIQNIHKLTGATILYVTHDQSEALAMADRIIIMKDGAVEQIGTPREIYRDPQTVFAATFVSRCNLLKGSWCGDSFHVKDENILLRNPMIPMEFRNKGLYPIRPEQLTIQPEGNGIQGIIVNKQYNGREIHYSVQHRDEVLTIYAGCQAEYNPGDHISFTLSA